MIISRTPFRISFFGGGTDYPVWYKKHKGAVLSTSINKYCYISCRYLPQFFDHKHRLVYSKFENIHEIDEIQHPAIREVFRFMNIEKGLEIHHDADLPGKSGLGSSSSFTVGLLNALYALRGQMVSKERLANEAVYIEQNMIRENVGSQDQFASSFGGFNKIIFNEDESINVFPVIVSEQKIKILQDHLLLFFTGFTRFASDIAGEQIKSTSQKYDDLVTMYQMVDEAVSILSHDNSEINEFGILLNDAWKIKRALSSKISNSEIDEMYNAACNAGASGGKLIGAGGGGFMVIFAQPEYHKKIKLALKNLLLVPIRFDTAGSQIIFYNPDYFDNNK